MRRLVAAVALLLLHVSAAQADGEQDFVRLFSSACAKTFPTHSGAAAVAEKAGLKKQKDGTFKADSFLLNPAVKLSGGGGIACLLMRHNADPVQSGDLLVKALSSSGVEVQKASRKGRRTTLTVLANGKPARILVEPSMRTFTSIAIMNP